MVLHLVHNLLTIFFFTYTLMYVTIITGTQKPTKLKMARKAGKRYNMQRMKIEKIIYNVMIQTETGADKVGEYIHDKMDEKTGQVKELKSKRAIKTAIETIVDSETAKKAFLVIADTKTALYEMADADFWANATRVED